MNLKIVRDQTLAQKIVVVDGLTGSGKALMAPVLSSLRKAELWQLDYIFDYINILYRFKKIQKDAAMAMIKLYADMDLYNSRISRYANFRRMDPSGVYANLLADRYKKRLKLKDGKSVVLDIQKENPLLVLVVHFSFGNSNLLFQTLRKRLLLYLLMERHPAHAVEAWYNTHLQPRRYNVDPRDFDICIQSHGRIAPWFAAEWIDQYKRLSPLEQAIQSVAGVNKSFDKQKMLLSSGDRRKLLVIPFEKFVRQPQEFIQPIARQLRTKTTVLTKQVMRFSNLPRAFTRQDLNRQIDKIDSLIGQQKISPKSRNLFHKICRDYEVRNGLRGLAS